MLDPSATYGILQTMRELILVCIIFGSYTG